VAFVRLAQEWTFEDLRDKEERRCKYEDFPIRHFNGVVLLKAVGAEPVAACRKLVRLRHGLILQTYLAVEGFLYSES
jgi:hypothetical protein